MISLKFPFYTMTLAFFIGFISAFHCIGMCGGIIGALTLSLHPDKRSNILELSKYSIAYNLGRILSYCFAGLLVGIISEIIIELIPLSGGLVLHMLLNLFIIMLGLFIGGWLPQLALIEKLGQPIWQRLQPLGNRFLPVKELHHAFLFGLIWGWIPCGLAYYALSIALTQGGITESVLFMFAFGMGTFLPMLLTMLLAGSLSGYQHSKKLRNISAVIIILTGVIGLIMLLIPNPSLYINIKGS
ncbi:MAG: sulfite exporter TauE/SafE family protein [Thiotrichaceae bacterium]|nr:sulfite exporter TauE/SafE family protein [Thiotrichaceae bacterium]